MTIKLIALDLDGTTLNKEGKLSPKTREAFEKAIDRGVNIVIATGRCFDALPAELIEFGTSICHYFQRCPDQGHEDG